MGARGFPGAPAEQECKAHTQKNLPKKRRTNEKPGSGTPRPPPPREKTTGQ